MKELAISRLAHSASNHCLIFSGNTDTSFTKIAFEKESKNRLARSAEMRLITLLPIKANSDPASQTASSKQENHVAIFRF